MRFGVPSFLKRGGASGFANRPRLDPYAETPKGPAGDLDAPPLSFDELPPVETQPKDQGAIHRDELPQDDPEDAPFQNTGSDSHDVVGSDAGAPPETKEPVTDRPFVDPELLSSFGGGESFSSKAKAYLVMIAVSAVTALAVSMFQTSGIVNEAKAVLVKVSAKANEVAANTDKVQKNTVTVQNATVAVDGSVARAETSEANAKKSADAAASSAQTAGKRLASIVRFAEQVSKDANRAATAAASVERSAKSINADSIRAEIDKIRAEMRAGTNLDEIRVEFRTELNKVRNDTIKFVRTINGDGLVNTARREALFVIQLSREKQNRERQRLGDK